METRTCQNCKGEFVIEQEDFKFYEKMNVPPPTWCPECRMMRRLASINVWSLFWRNCDRCGERTMSMYSPKSKLKVFCNKCWWSDEWDGTEYALDYDPSRSFLEQVKELSEKTPYAAKETLYTSLKNSDYSNGLSWCKDCYMIFWADYCEMVFYSSILNNLKFSLDCLRAKNSELCYQGTGLYKCYNTFFSSDCEACVNVWFSRDCHSCTDCVGCVNLRGATHCIFNIKYTKEEYGKKIKELGLNSWSKLRELEQKAREFWFSKPYREYNGDSFNLNVTGDYVYTSKNSKEMYMVTDGSENSKWCQLVTVGPIKDCFDYSGWGNNATVMYECSGVGENVNNNLFSYRCTPDIMNVQYTILSTAVKNCLGCVNLKRKSYCILNKQYSKKDYEKLKEKIIEDMKNNPYIDKLGRKYFYGEFFPPEMSVFPYNKSVAMRFIPKTKDEALAIGYSWDDEENPAARPSMKADSLPETIQETSDTILDEIIKCANCSKPYRITQGELGMMRKLNLPLPHDCPKCREDERFTARTNKPKLYNRVCAKCEAPIYTPYAPDDPRIVYCVSCYQQEFL